MKRSELEHIIRAAGAIADDREIVVIGSQSILGQLPDAPATFRVSMEADVYPLQHPDRSDLIEGSIGEGSPFHEQFGYYAQGVSERTAVLPDGWRTRLVRIENANTRGIVGWCLDVHDLAVSKYVAGRPKDIEFNRELARHRITRKATLLSRLAETRLPPALGTLVKGRIERDFSAPRSTGTPRTSRRR